MQISHEHLRSILHYMPETGILTWIIAPKHRPIKAGDRAGRPDPYRGKNYRAITIDGIKYKEHRLIYFWMTGKWPPNQIDHKNTDQSDNRWDNLRIADGSQNQANRKVTIRNSLGIKGVRTRTLANGKTKYIAQISHRGKVIHIGMFETAESAHDAYCRQAKVLHQEFFNGG